MKKIMLLVVAVATLSACDKEEVIVETELPNAAREYIETHFDGAEVIQVVKDVDGLRKSYDVYLSTGIELEFNKSGEIRSVESNRNERLPDSVIPAKILTYVQANYTDSYIISWSKDDRDQEVELNNGMDLKFNSNGDFIRID